MSPGRLRYERHCEAHALDDASCDERALLRAATALQHPWDEPEMTEGVFPSYSQMTNAEVFAFTRLRRVQMLAERRNHIFGRYGPTQYGKRAVAEFIAQSVGRLQLRVRAQISRHVVHLLWVAQDGLCYICGGAMKGKRLSSRHPERRSIDHVVPICRGGANHGNVLLAHVRCNEEKADRAPTIEELATLERINLALGIAA